LASLGVNSKRLIHLRHGLNPDGIFGVEFDCIEGLSSGAGSARSVDELWATGTLIIVLIRELVNFRCSAIVLSATDATARRRRSCA
jgi:hypothetical protein